jgi:hypothetical protein
VPLQIIYVYYDKMTGFNGMKNNNHRKTRWIFLSSLLIIITVVAFFPQVTNALFDEQEAYSYLEKQLSFGPRTPGSKGHDDFIAWSADEFSKMGWTVSFQKGTYRDHPITNIIASRNDDKEDLPWILLGAHYDTRLLADSDPEIKNQTEPVLGANDGASGVSVLLALASALPEDLNKRIWIVLFDAEDQGRIQGWDHWCIGSTLLAQHFEKEEKKPDAVVVVDMIGDQDLQIFRESNSTASLTDEIWKIAEEEGYGNILKNEEKYSIQDDHIPFINIGIPAVDLIDFQYDAWHTISDDISQISEKSLAIVGNVLYSWLTKQ